MYQSFITHVQSHALLTEQAWSIKDLLYGFIVKLRLQKPKQNMKLFCSDRNSLQWAGVRFIFSVSSFGLVYNHGKLGILNSFTVA